MATSAPSRAKVAASTSFQSNFAVFLLYGFSFVGKLFVYVSFPLTALFLLDRRILLDRVYNALTIKGPLTGVTWALLLSTVYGVIGVVYGLLSEHPPLTTFEVFAFNICPWFLFFGILAGTNRPSAARDYIRFFAWFHAILTPLYFLFLRHITLVVPGTDTNLLQPGSGSLILLGLFCYENNLKKFWFPILVCSFETIASQIRADWLGLLVVLVIWGVATKHIKRVLMITATLATLLIVGLVSDIRIEALPGRGGEISARDTVGRALSGISYDTAQEYSPNAGTYAGTVQWREKWWKAIRDKVFESTTTTVFGLGLGYPIKDLVSYLRGMEIRSPHSVFYFTLAYSGLLGVSFFFVFEASLLQLLWRNFKNTGQIFGFVTLIYFLVQSFFGNFFESPQSAVPSYLVIGLSLGPMLLDRVTEKANARRVRLTPKQVSERAWQQLVFTQE